MSDLWGNFAKRLEVYTEGKTSIKDLNYAVHVSLKYKYIYVETPKVACSTIKTTLQRLELEAPTFERVDFEDIHKREFSPLLRLQQLPEFEKNLGGNDFQKFCFVRNPYARFLSCYLDKITNPTNFRKSVLKWMGLDENNLEYEISFEEFISVVEQQKPLEMDYHWRPQTYATCQNMINYDFVGRMETFTEDFERIGSKLSPEFDRYYASERRHRTNALDLQEQYYTNSLYARIYQIYQDDFEMFSYDPIL